MLFIGLGQLAEVLPRLPVMLTRLVQRSHLAGADGGRAGGDGGDGEGGRDGGSEGGRLGGGGDGGGGTGGGLGERSSRIENTRNASILNVTPC